jgi:hypothetical protein
MAHYAAQRTAYSSADGATEYAALYAAHGRAIHAAVRRPERTTK